MTLIFRARKEQIELDQASGNEDRTDPPPPIPDTARAANIVPIEGAKPQNMVPDPEWGYGAM